MHGRALGWWGLLALGLAGVALAADAPEAGEQAEEAAGELGEVELPLDLPPEPTPAPAPQLDPETPVAELLASFGEARPEHGFEGSEDQVRMGRELVNQGWTTRDGKRTRRTSPAFLCTHCHNTQREDPDLRRSDADTRLAWADEHDLPLLPGTTFWGMVNRTSWFNDDYVKKYGALVEPANASLVQAIQLCNAECSQGRILDGWEVEALVAYFWTLGITLGDLELSEADAELVARATLDDALHAAGIAALRGAFLSASPAHTVEPPHDREAGVGLVGDPARGQSVYERGCLHCHARPGPGQVGFSQKKGAIKDLYDERLGSTDRKLYNAIRHGTRPYGVPPAYMPFYTQERMSEQQVADLVAYFEHVLGTGGER